MQRNLVISRFKTKKPINEYAQRLTLASILSLTLLFFACVGAFAGTATAVSSGFDHAVAVMDDGTLRAWGYGALGNGQFTEPQSEPVIVQVLGLKGIVSASAGYYCTVAAKNDGTVWAWGYNNHGQLGDGTKTDRYTPVQVPGLTGVIAVSAADWDTVALKSDGTVWTWGAEYYGLGDGTWIDHPTPVQVPGLTNVIAISAGTWHTCALKSDGTVWAWGSNYAGQLGDGTTIDRSTPVQVSGLTGVVAISVGWDHTLALKNDGTVWAWGWNYFGQLGDGTTSERHTPVQVSDLTGVISISAGCQYSMALKSDGTAQSWGNNLSGQLGDGTTIERHTPLQVSGLTGLKAISAGGEISAVIKNDGTVWYWGWQNLLSPKKLTVQPSDLTGPVGTVTINNNAANTSATSITLKLSATDNSGTVCQMRISDDGVFDTEPWESYSTTKARTLSSGDGVKTVYVMYRDALWNESEVATDNITLDTTPPLGFTPVVNPPDVENDDFRVTFSTSDATSGINHYEVSMDGGSFSPSASPYIVSADGMHTIAVKAVDNAGNSCIAQTTAYIERTAPSVAISSPLADHDDIVYKVSYVDAESISLSSEDIVLNKTGTADGAVSVSGSGNITRTVRISNITGDGSLGISIAADTAVDAFGRKSRSIGPSIMFKVGIRVTSISSGGSHSAALRNDGTVWLWGSNSKGQLGDGTSIQRLSPSLSLADHITAISTGSNSTIALKDDGTVWSWGSNSSGQLGDGTTINRLSPVQVVGLGNVAAISAGLNYMVALKNDGTVWTWGSNFTGQLGNGTRADSSIPVQVIGLTDVVTISAGSNFVIALKNDGTVWSWGSNNYGQLGDGTTLQQLTPVQAIGLDNVIAISAGYNHVLALKNDNSLWSWGYNNYGQLGDGTTANHSSPAQLSSVNNVVAISAGNGHSVAIKNNGTVWTWGLNGQGQLGDGTTNINSFPKPINDLSGVIAVAAGNYDTIALMSDGNVWSWGSNTSGQLGDGTIVSKSLPVQVVFDSTGPSGVVCINNGARYSDSTSISLALSATDDSGTVYQMALSNDGVFDTEPWEDYATAKSWILADGSGVKTVYVKFRDSWGNESAVVTDSIVLSKIGALQAKQCQDGSIINIDGAIVSAAFDGFFYVESDNRECGIRVEKAGHNIFAGMRVNINGSMATNSNGERYIQADTVAQTQAPNDTGIVKPLGMTNKALGGIDQDYVTDSDRLLTIGGQKGVKNGYGLNNIGLLVKVWGKVTGYEQAENPTWFTISDGSGADVKCIIPAGTMFNKSWKHVSITGISSCEKVGDDLQRVLLVKPGASISSNQE